MLDPGVKSFGVFAHDDEVYIRVACGDVRQVPDRTEVGVQLKMFSEFDVNAGEASANRRGHRPLQPNTGALDGVDQLFWDVFPILFISLSSGFVNLPLELHARGFQNAHGRLSNFRADAIAGNESNLVRHRSN